MPGLKKDTSSKKERENLEAQKRVFFFPDYPASIREALQLDDVAMYSITDMRTAHRITQDILNLVGPEATITDASACIGGNTLSLGPHFHKVQAVEWDPRRCNMLRHNVSVCHLESKVEVICRNYCDIVQDLEQDLVFLDPPWGGPEYYLSESMLDLNFGSLELWTLVEQLKGHVSYVVIKVPLNFNVDKFQLHVSVHVDIRRDLRKMLLLCLDYRAFESAKSSSLTTSCEPKLPPVIQGEPVTVVTPRRQDIALRSLNSREDPDIQLRPVTRKPFGKQDGCDTR